jgi:hypothetical protein
VPGALLSEKKLQLLRPTARENAAAWYKPGIWAMPKDGATGLVSHYKPDGLMLMIADPPYMLKFKEKKAYRKTSSGWKEISWNDVVSSKRY